MLFVAITIKKNGTIEILKSNCSKNHLYNSSLVANMEF